MHPGVADQTGGRRAAQHPRQRPIGLGPVAQHGLIASQIGAKSAVETKHGPGREAALPERVGVFKAVVRELPATHIFPVDVQRAPIQPQAGWGQARAGRKRNRTWREGKEHRGKGWWCKPESALGGRGRLRDNIANLNPTEESLPARPDPSSPGDAPPEIMHEVSGWRRLAFWPLALLVRLWGRSLTFELSAQARRDLARFDEPLAMVIWHNRVFWAEIFRRYRSARPVHGLISNSRDGAWSAAFFRLAGLRAVRGSSKRGGHAAARELVEVLRAGHDVGITPDGPRGPRYDFKAGPVVVARRSGASVLLVGGSFESAWQLPSWDRLDLPRPFSGCGSNANMCPTRSSPRRAPTAALAARLRKLSPTTTKRYRCGARRRDHPAVRRWAQA